MISFALVVLSVFATATVAMHVTFDHVTWWTVGWALVAVVSILGATWRRA